MEESPCGVNRRLLGHRMNTGQTCSEGQTGHKGHRRRQLKLYLLSGFVPFTGPPCGHLTQYKVPGYTFSTHNALKPVNNSKLWDI